MALLPHAAAANARGGNVYMRLGPGVKDSHPGVVMIDDLAANTVEQLSKDGLEPCLVVQTSAGNFQAWIRLVASGTVPYATMGLVARHLAHAYGGDERAVSPRQPGRLPGFTNRKPKHQLQDGRFPFVKLNHAEPGRVANAGIALLNRLASFDTAGAAAGAGPQTPRGAAEASTNIDPEIALVLDAIHSEQRERIMRELAASRRAPHAASESEVDFAVARAATQRGIAPEQVSAWIAARRPEKGRSYPESTLDAAMVPRYCR
ncbi:DNA-primase RepB domain-containing protein [Devosia sp.]|uniref:DNA-primase RepB domain-containing protein n=1 Tax=Devosia sp. TaxID=1871048 RepID=UPI002EF74596